MPIHPIVPQLPPEAAGNSTPAVFDATSAATLKVTAVRAYENPDTSVPAAPVSVGSDVNRPMYQFASDPHADT